MTRLLSLLSVFALLATAACGPIKKEASYPTRPEGSDKILYSDQKRETIWGEDDTLSTVLFGDKKDENTSGIGVNSFLWRAALDTISFMPVASADPFGGVILTDWYENPETPGERYKLNVYILDRQLRADGVRVSVFKQKLEAPANKKKKAEPVWRDEKIADTMATSIENSILARARELRVAQAAPKAK